LVKPRILIVDDDAAMCELTTGRLERRGFAATSRQSVAEAMALLATEEVDVVIADYNMPGTTGISLCEQMTGNRPDVPVVLITAFGSLETAIAAIRAGAFDFLTKPFEIEQLLLIIERALQHRALKEEVRRLRRAVVESARFGEILGDSPAIKRSCELVARAAGSDATVLITGESGTGKELVARALHERGSRKAKPFVAVNCAGLTETLLESEIFGHKRGAFTDARESRPGLFVQANGGTVFLDEIGDMPVGMQSKLLRAIEGRTVRPVGSDTEVPIDVRFVTATNRDLESDVEDGRFRRDLFFRINVIHIEVPALRARGNDILLLAQHFLERAATRSGKAVVGFSPAAAERLLGYPWPGNVRELQNAVERAVALTAFENIVPEDLPERIHRHRRSQIVVAGDDPAALLPMHEVERRYILHVLNTMQGNKTIAARILGFDRRTMYRKLERYERGSVDPDTGGEDD
ncbi:MAG TPA: sigma-54 dependent transcriptional regulator, partial [Polyangia bacterium]|nr:sigma-54 dependent transcriptional regulator [Polyangia bacterium]